MSLKIGITEE